MTECPIHRAMDGLAGSLSIRTLRCAHFGDGYVHERIDEETGRRWFNWIFADRGRRPLLIAGDGSDWGEDVWRWLVETMRDDE